MSVDKLVDSTQLDSDLTSVANAIRTKGGTSASLAFPAGFVSAIQNIPTGGGGATTLASGTFVGNNGSDSSITGRQEFNIGSKMAKTDFGVLITANDGADIAKSTSRKFIWMYYRCENMMGGFDLSSDGNKSFVASSYSVDSDDSGTITTRAVASLISFGKQLYNGSVQNVSDMWFQIRKYSDHFGLAAGISNSAYQFTSECTYSWKIVYFGSNPSTDIVEIS